MEEDDVVGANVAAGRIDVVVPATIDQKVLLHKEESRVMCSRYWSLSFLLHHIKAVFQWSQTLDRHTIQSVRRLRIGIMTSENIQP